MKIALDVSALRMIPENTWAWSVAEKLHHHGFQVYFVGGCVRDWLLGRTPRDLDLVSNARPEEIERIFPKTVGVGKAFGVMCVLGDQPGQETEVATFRKDGLYIDGRRPQEVEYSTPQEDAERRDFTVNGLMANPWSGDIDDFVGGLEDLNARLLRAIGDPRARFHEDRLRILRAIRFAAVLDFSIETQTWQALVDLRGEIKSVSVERIREETEKMLTVPEASLEMLEISGIREEVFPEFSDVRSFLATPTFVNLWKESREFGAWARWAVWMFCADVVNVKAKRSQQHWDAFLKRLKFSAQDQKKIKVFLETMGLASRWRELSAGERLLRRQEDGVEWALACLASGVADGVVAESAAFWVAEKETKRQHGSLPVAFLNGHDFFGRCQPAEMGRFLRRAYVAQIEGAFQDRDEALLWLDKTYPLRSNENQ